MSKVTQIFSFGYGQLYPNGYIKITAENAKAARAEMFRLYGPKWSMQYNEDQEQSLQSFGMYLVEEISI